MPRSRRRRGANSSARRWSTISRPAIGAPSGFVSAVVPALGALSRLSTGTLVVTDREIKLSGDAFFDAAVTQIRASLAKDFPQGWQVKADISVKPAAAPVDPTVCQQLFSELLAKGRIRFEPGRAIIDQDSAGLLDRLIETAMRCPDRQDRDRRHIPMPTARTPSTRPCPRNAPRPCWTIWSGRACRRAGSRRSATAARSRSRQMIPTKARRRTAASISW